MEESEQSRGRFRVYSKDKKIELHGAISDTSDFNPIKEMIEENNTIDFTGLESASWLGLIGLDQFLRETGKSFKLINIPSGIYKYFRLLPDIDIYELDLFNLEQFQGDNFQKVEKPFACTKADLVKLADEQPNRVIETESNLRIDGYINKWLPERFREKPSNLDFKNSWYKENAEEAYFWSNFLEFWVATLGLSLDMIGSQRVGLSQVLGRIESRVLSAEDGFIKCEKKIKQNSKKLSEIINSIKEECLRVQDQIFQVLETAEVQKRKIISWGDDSKFDSPKDFYQCLGDSADSIESFQAYLQEIESVSSKAGDRLLSLGIVEKLEQTLKETDQEGINAEEVEQLREAFNIMDPFSENTWENTKEEITAEINMIEADLGKSIVLFQGFDLLRQVLEHRIGESLQLKMRLADLEAKRIEWSDVKKVLFQEIKRHVVTDQEKNCFSFFLPDGFDEKSLENAQKPGVAVLF